MKKLFVAVSSSFSSLFIYLFSAFPAFAADPSLNPCTGTGITKTLCDLGATPGNTIRGVVLFLVMIAIVIALIYLLYGGIKWITSKGDKTEVESARNHIIAAIIGLIVVFLAIFILAVVLQAFGIDFNELKIPVIGTSSTTVPTPTP